MLGGIGGRDGGDGGGALRRGDGGVVSGCSEREMRGEGRRVMSEKTACSALFR